MLSFDKVPLNEDDDKAKFQKLYIAYRQKMWYAANCVLSDEYLAEDAVHNAFIGISKNMDKIGDIESSKTFSYVITAAKNAAIDIVRKRANSSPIDIGDLYGLSDTDSSSFSEKFEAEDALLAALKNIPEVYRDVLFYLTSENMTEKEIASLLGRKAGTVHQQVRRARILLKKELEKGATNNADK